MFIEDIIHAFISGLPGTKVTLFLLLVFIIWAFICAKVPAILKTKKNVQTGYSRKAYHFLVFTSVAVINILFGFSGVCLFGIVISCFIFYAVMKREASGLYLALARESDAPHGTLYIVLPYFSTLLGGLLLNYFFPGYVALGYLICGLADASGEVIGTMFGKHRYRVRILNLHNSFKSIEGSVSVWLLCFTIYLIFTFGHEYPVTPNVLLLIVISSFIIMVVEILTPKGFDNLSIQLIAVLAYKFVVL